MHRQLNKDFLSGVSNAKSPRPLERRNEMSNRVRKWKIGFVVCQCQAKELLLEDGDVKMVIKGRIKWLDEHIKNRYFKIRRIK